MSFHVFCRVEQAIVSQQNQRRDLRQHRPCSKLWIWVAGTKLKNQSRTTV